MILIDVASPRHWARHDNLGRNARQKKQLQEEWADLIASGLMVIPDAPLDGLNLISFSDLVVSGGGAMNREAAALGVPVYSLEWKCLTHHSAR